MTNPAWHTITQLNIRVDGKVYHIKIYPQHIGIEAEMGGVNKLLGMLSNANADLVYNPATGVWDDSVLHRLIDQYNWGNDKPMRRYWIVFEQDGEAISARSGKGDLDVLPHDGVGALPLLLVSFEDQNLQVAAYYSRSLTPEQAVTLTHEAIHEGKIG